MSNVKLMRAIDTPNFIQEVEKNSAIWDTHDEDYSNKPVKKSAWKNVILKFFPDFENRPLHVQHEIEASIHTKWRSIRTCYSREVLKRKSEKGGPSYRRQYLYFDYLRFLDSVCKHLATGSEEINKCEWDKNNLEVILGMETETSSSTPNLKKIRKKRKRQMEEEEEEPEIINVLKHEVVPENEPTTSSGSEEDRLFLLSLVSEMEKVPEEYKLKLKIEILTAISNAQHGFFE